MQHTQIYLCFQKYGVRCDVESGVYKLIPFTTGCRFKRRTRDSEVETKLVKKKDNSYLMTPAFKEALTEIFDLCDLDEDGLMSRDEFNWFNVRTSGEEVNDEEWTVVEGVLIITANDDSMPDNSIIPMMKSELV